MIERCKVSIPERLVNHSIVSITDMAVRGVGKYVIATIRSSVQPQ